MEPEGILLINKKKGNSSFHLVSVLRKITNVKKIGHCGTLDPLATGVMILLIGKNYTKKTNLFIDHEKEYLAEITLGKTTQTFDSEGTINDYSSVIPHEKDLKKAISNHFQGVIYQIPPMYSAKKIKGKKLYKLARQGIFIDRDPVKIYLVTELISYIYPHVKLKIVCSKGTYIRSIANDLGKKLGCGGYLSALCRTRVGPFRLNECIDQSFLYEKNIDIIPLLKKI